MFDSLRYDTIRLDLQGKHGDFVDIVEYEMYNPPRPKEEQKARAKKIPLKRMKTLRGDVIGEDKLVIDGKVISAIKSVNIDTQENAVTAAHCHGVCH